MDKHVERFKFNFTHNKAKEGDYFTKRVGDVYIPLKVIETNQETQTLVTTQTGIKIRLTSSKRGVNNG